jgi:hypothetical protein
MIPADSELIGLVGFEPTACRRGDRSRISCRVHLDPARSYSIVRAALLRSEWQSFQYGLEPMEFHVSSPWIHQRYGGESGQSNYRKNRRSDAQSFGCAIRNNRTLARK